MYFLGGSTVRGGIKGLLGYVVGIVLGVVIFELLSLFGSANWWAMPLAILLPVIPVMCLQEVEWLSYIPAIFLGCGAYFAILSYAAPVKPLAVSGTERWSAYLDAAGWELALCAVGLIFGWLAISGKGLIVDKLFPTQTSEAKDDVATSEGMRTS